MAEVVADRLLGGDGDVPRRGHVDQAQAARRRRGLLRRRARRAEARSTSSYTDPATGVYTKLVLSDDAQTLLGGVLVGDAAPYADAAGLPSAARCPAPPLALLAPGRRRPARRRRCPTRAQVCSCNAVTKDDDRRARSRERLRRRAGAQGVHQGRHQLRLLRAAAQAAARRVPASRSRKALCEHFDHSRAGAVRHRPGARHPHLLRSSSPSTARGRGCDICKPAVASILASLGSGHILDGEQAALQDTNDHFLANLQRDGTYSVVPRIPGGEITPEKLIVIGEVARDFGLYTKITGGQRIDLFGARVEQLPQIWRRLVDAGFESGHAYGKALRTVKSCVGSTWCRYGVQDSVGLADRAGAALPGAARAAQAQVGGLRLRPRVRRGAQQGLRHHRHRERLEPLRRRQRRLPARATPTCSPPTCPPRSWSAASTGS